MSAPELRANGRGGMAVIVGLVLSLIVAACGPAGQPTNETPPEDEEAPEEFSFRYTSPAGSRSALGQGADWWADRLNEVSDGRVTVEMFHDSALVPATEELAAVQDGRADIGYLVNFFFSDELPLFDIAGMPFVSEDAEAILQTLAELLQTNEDFQAEFEAQELHVLFFMPVGSGILVFSDPAESLDDLEGLRMRTSGLTAFALEQVGVDPVFIPTAEIFESLQRGIIDGIGGFDFDLSISLGFHEAGPYIVQPGLGQYSSVAVAMRKDVWDDLPSDIQEAFEQASREYMEEVAIDMALQFNAQACDRFLEAGGDVTVWPESQTERWAEQVGIDALHNRWIDAAVDRAVSRDAAERFLEQFTRGVADREGQGEYIDGARACADR